MTFIKLALFSHHFDLAKSTFDSVNDPPRNRFNYTDDKMIHRKSRLKESLKRKYLILNESPII